MRVCDNCHEAVPVIEVEVIQKATAPGLASPVLVATTDSLLFSGEYCSECVLALKGRDWSELAKRQPAPKTPEKKVAARTRKSSKTVKSFEDAVEKVATDPVTTSPGPDEERPRPTLAEVNAARDAVGMPPLRGEDDSIVIDDPDILEDINLND